MHPKFSETSYGFAVTREIEKHLTNKNNSILLQAPSFPTLRQERKLGYDVKIDIPQASGPVILQFKLGEHISQAHKKSPTWPHAREAHYRIDFPSNHHQLQLLQSLENNLKQNKKPAIIKYLAPAFTELGVFSNHYQNETIIKHSYSCNPSDIPSDGNKHHLVFVPGNTAPLTPSRLFTLSEPHEIAISDLLNELDNLLSPSNLATNAKGSTTVEQVSEFLEVQAQERKINTEKMRESIIDANNEPFGFNEFPELREVEFITNLGLAMDILIGFPAVIFQKD